MLNNDSLLIGNAGSGKSTLLIRLFVHYFESLNEEKVIPLFVDLSELKEVKLSQNKQLYEELSTYAQKIK